ncbi:hypothetical protein GGR51DRAFT_570885 [Nemania sp. FL0031]|nr:hypothetical protein GGR51DRAFT_570885 [Nemania sp. FL0031]
MLGLRAYFIILVIYGFLFYRSNTTIHSHSSYQLNLAWEDGSALAAVDVFLTRVGVVLHAFAISPLSTVHLIRDYPALVVINNRGLNSFNDRAAVEPLVQPLSYGQVRKDEMETTISILARKFIQQFLWDYVRQCSPLLALYAAAHPYTSLWRQMLGIRNRITSKLSAYRSRSGTKTSSSESATKTDRRGSRDEEAFRIQGWLPADTFTNVRTAWDEHNLEHLEQLYAASSTPSIYAMSSVRVYRSSTNVV